VALFRNAELGAFNAKPGGGMRNGAYGLATGLSCFTVTPGLVERPRAGPGSALTSLS